MLKHFGVALSLLALVVFVGCKSAPKKEMEVDTAEATAEAVVETPEPTEEPTAAPTAAPVAKDRRYRVVKDDTLWDISGSTNAYEDPWLWPLIYKANHAEIDDPDLIFEDQEFSIPKGVTESEMADATDKAKNTPRYRPHSKPRQSLPLDYLD